MSSCTGNLSDTIGDFEAAIKQDSQDPDIYYHRGQVYFITGELDKALADYERSTELDDNFIFSHIQRVSSHLPLCCSSWQC